MKFIKLEILNLASLDRKDGEVIDFVEGPIGDCNIFSIVGPTGSGKSTILDAICLALYASAPRYPLKPGQQGRIKILGDKVENAEKKRIAPKDPRNILTRGTKAGYSKLTFLANNGNVYRAEWHVKFNRVNYDRAVTSLFRITETDGIRKEEPVEWSSIPEIIGLDYDQFLRTVLIAQGSFANFLTASEDERYALLEKLIGCKDLYENISAKIKDRKDAAVQEYNRVVSELKAQEEGLIPEEELPAFREKAARLEEEEKKVREELAKVNEALAWFAAETKLVEDIGVLDASYQDAARNLENIRNQVDDLNLHDATLPAVDLSRNIQAGRNALGELDESLEKLCKDIAEKNKKIDDEGARLEEFRKVARNASEEFEAQKPHIRKALEIKAVLDATEKARSEKETARNAAESAFSKARQDVLDNAAAIAKAEKAVSDSGRKLKEIITGCEAEREELKKAAEMAMTLYDVENKKLEGKDIGSLQAAKEAAESVCDDLKEAIRVQGELQEKTADRRSRQDNRTALSVRNREIDDELKKFDIEARSKELETLSKSYILMTSENWEAHRSCLADGEPCPLCGSLHHPYSLKEYFRPVADELKQQIDVKQAALASLMAEKQELEKERNFNSGSLEGLESSLATLGNEIEGLKDRLDAVLRRHGDWPKNVDGLNSLVADVDNAATTAAAELNACHELLKSVAGLRRKKESAEKKLADHNERSLELRKKAEGELNESNNALAAEKGKTENLVGQLTEKSDALRDAGETLEKAVADVAARKEELKAEIGERDPEAYEQELAGAKDSADRAVTGQIDLVGKLRGEVNGLKGREETTRQSRQAEAERLSKNITGLQDWLACYNEHHRTSLSAEDISRLSSLTSDWEGIRSLRSRLSDALTSARTSLENKKKELETHQKNKPDKDRESLALLKEELDGRSNTELVEVKARLLRHETAASRMGDMLVRRNEAEALKKEWEEIYDAIGGDGKTLRKIAQCYTLRFLVEHANDEIRRFNTRYELQQVEHSLGIRVIDHDRADDVRDTTSLSGGETFIVSLGLALGLSSLSSKNISFENLFIDEGFGTLDPDTLSTVIDSLAMLQSSQGKKVGVISHTDMMSERITTQIRIIKHGHSGSSHIEIRR